jgi:sugar phosphate isomerase/epimerase
MASSPPELQLSQTTIFKEQTGCPEPHLRQIAEAGFTHLHWSHHWYTDFLYSASEVAQIGRWLKDYGLQVLDVHASAGQEKRWDAAEPYRRLAGVELVRNRLEFAARLGAEAIVLHAYADMPLDSQRRSLSELEPLARLLGVRIALENLTDGNLENLPRLFSEFSPEMLGFCYDAGHGNMFAYGMDFLEQWKERLAVIHIHDNDGTGDQHKLPFSGSVPWERFTHILAASAYTGPINLECTMGSHAGLSEEEFLRQSHQAGARLEAMRRAQQVNHGSH